MKKQTYLMLATSLTVLAVILVLLVSFQISDYKNKYITSFEECVAAGNPIMESYPRQCSADGKIFVEQIKVNLSEYFFNRIIDVGIRSLGAIPVEGFTPDLYMGAFPKLTNSDFDNVAAIGGKWTVFNDQLVFRRDDSQGITSADGTISPEGAEQLMKNIATRLHMSINSQEDVDKLIDTIQ